MSETEANTTNYNILIQAKNTKQWVRVLAHGRLEDCQVNKISWDDMEDRVYFKTKSGDSHWNVVIPGITKLQLL